MKPIRFFQRLSVIALCATTAVSVFAQAPTSRATGGSSVFAPTPSAASGFSCEVPAGQLEEAVAIITEAAEAKGFEMPTTLFAPDTAEIKVPRLKLRSVKPSGALSLLAAAAGCDVEQVVAPEGGEISGWIFKAKPPQSGHWKWGVGGPHSGGSMPGAGFDQNQLAPGGGGGLAQLPLIGRLFTPGTAPGGGVPPIDTPAIPTEPDPGAPATVLPPTEPLGVIGLGGGTPPQVPVTRVYAVGLLLDESKPDAAKLLQKTLQEVLEVSASDEKPRTPPSLSFHDGTKLLVAKATPEAQVLIEQTLQAMTQNANDSKSGRRSANAFRLWRQDEGSERSEATPKAEEKPVGPGLPPSSQPSKR